jgi:carboxyl-terminal processing protease
MLSRKRFPRLFLPLIPFLLAALACQAVFGAWQASPTSPLSPSQTSTPIASVGTSTPSLTPLPTLTLTPTRAPSPTPPPPTSTNTPTLNPTETALQLQVFEELWEAINDNYLYPDFNGLDWNAVHAEYSRRIENGLSQADFYLALQEMVSRLGDEHSVYFSPNEAAAIDNEFAGNFDYVGIGVLSIVVPECDCLAIILVFPDSPAEEAGLRAHDNILAVDDQPILDENGMRRDLLRGPEGTSLKISVRSPGQPARQVEIIRRRIAASLPVPHQNLSTPAGKRIGYILLPTFNEADIDEGVQQALADLNASGRLDGLILDNRQNGGGSSEVFSNTLAYFMQGQAGRFVDRQGERSLTIAGKDLYGSQQVPLVVLVGLETASFGEIFSGILKDIGRAYLIGEQTRGNVEILYIYNFFDGSRAWIAHATFRPLNHPDQDWEQTGIIPDLSIPVNWASVTLESDPAIQAALEHFDQ